MAENSRNTAIASISYHLVIATPDRSTDRSAGQYATTGSAGVKFVFTKFVFRSEAAFKVLSICFTKESSESETERMI